MKQLSLAAQMGRGLDVLEFLARVRTFRVTDLARSMECSRRHAYRIVNVLVARDLVALDRAPIRGHVPARWRSQPGRILRGAG